MFFTKYEYFMYFLVSWFFTPFFAGSSPVHILGFVGSVLITLHHTDSTMPIFSPETSSSNLGRHFTGIVQMKVRGTFGRLISSSSESL